MIETIYSDPNYLAHYGVKGMHWGVRKAIENAGNSARNRFNTGLTDELYHYGVKGMKWGVRRYRNFSGTYTQAGVKRFDAALDKYEKKKNDYGIVKKSDSSTRYDRQKAKSDMKSAKRDLNKHYKHLKLDKLGDKGKVKYAAGKTITGDRSVTKTLSSIGGLSITASQYMKMNGIGNSKAHNVLLGVGGVSIAAAGAKELKDAYDARQLRAFYSHTSRY